MADAYDDAINTLTSLQQTQNALLSHVGFQNENNAFAKYWFF